MTARLLRASFELWDWPADARIAGGAIVIEVEGAEHCTVERVASPAGRGWRVSGPAGASRGRHTPSIIGVLALVRAEREPDFRPGRAVVGSAPAPGARP